MTFLNELFLGESPASVVLILSLISALGLLCGSIRLFGIRLGVAGVMFAGVLFGHFHVTISSHVLEFIREFGLILFVYSIGIEVGPGFFSSLRKEGFFLNAFTLLLIALNTLLTIGIIVALKVPLAAGVGILSGATTNTPSLGAAQQALHDAHLPADIVSLCGLGYAVTYPFGIMGIILAMILLRVMFKVDVKESARQFQKDFGEHKKLDGIDVVVENTDLDGKLIGELEFFKEGVIVSRLLHAGQVVAPGSGTKVFCGDVLHLVGPKEKLIEIQSKIGILSLTDLRTIKSPISSQFLVVTKSNIFGKTLEDLDVREQYQIVITRINRSGIEFPALSNIKLNLGDVLTAVGEKDALERFAKVVGDSPKELDHPFVIPVFVGIVFGVILGSIPFQIPGIAVPVKLGLAGGPLIMALLLSRIGRIGNLVWYMPPGAIFMIRELGIVLFLACVGLKSGGKFIETIISTNGLLWLLCGALITFIPLFVVGWILMKKGINYLKVCGHLAGSCTDPPALAFANSIAASSAQSIAYATVYPLTMLSRVIIIQLLVIFFINR